MAVSKTKVEKEFTVEEKLKALYELQTIVSEIDRIKTLRGELPLEVQDLEDDIAGLQTRLQNYTAEVESLRTAITGKNVEIKNAKVLVEKYTLQQDNVRNNREFDFLSKEVEYQNLEIELCEKRIREFTIAEAAKSEEITSISAQLEERQQALAEKKSELDEIISETKQEEEKLREQAKKIEASIEPRLLTAFKRIRKNARNGLGVVYIERNACSGCFNKIPPQRQMDIKLHKKVIVCEYCGRIMVDKALANVE